MDKLKYNVGDKFILPSPAAGYVTLIIDKTDYSTNKHLLKSLSQENKYEKWQTELHIDYYFMPEKEIV